MDIILAAGTRRQRRLGARGRIHEAYEFAKANGRINRADIARIGEVSITQASADVAALMAEHPSLGLVYDRSKRTFVVKGTT